VDDDAMLEADPGAEIVVTSRLPEHLLEAADDLDWVQCLSAGVDFLDLKALEARDVALTSVSGIHGEPIGQQVVGYLLHFTRCFDRAIPQQAQREGSAIPRARSATPPSASSASAQSAARSPGTARPSTPA